MRIFEVRSKTDHEVLRRIMKTNESSRVLPLSNRDKLMLGVIYPSYNCYGECRK